MSERPFKIVGLVCTSALAQVLGATSVTALGPPTGTVSMLRHTGVCDGDAIAVATLTGEYFVWPLVPGAA